MIFELILIGDFIELYDSWLAWHVDLTLFDLRLLDRFLYEVCVIFWNRINLRLSKNYELDIS